MKTKINQQNAQLILD